jgi:sugar transferase (PEP-CTERM/EpsH1 system associated)
MHVVDNLGRGGLQNGLVNLINLLDSARFEHVVCAMRALDHVEAHVFGDGIRTLCIGAEAAHPRIQIPHLVRAIIDVQPDIVHSRNWAAVEAVAAARLVGGCRIVHSEHGFDDAAKQPWRRAAFRRLAFELADRVLCVSHQLKAAHAQRAGFSPHKISVIHNGVDTTRFRPDSAARARFRRELGIAEDELCIGAVGNLTPVKDHYTLVEATAELALQTRSWRLLLLGEGSERLRIEAFLDSHPEVKDRVRFLGIRNQVPGLLNAMDVYVLPSLTEGISNSLLEAMATGLPVIATETGGNPEVVVDGESGILFPVGDSCRLAMHLMRLHDCPAERTRLGDAALYRTLAHFSLSSMVREYEQFYASLGTDVERTARAVAGA